MKQFLKIILVVFPLWSSAQGYLPGGGRSLGMANAMVSISDEWAFFNNPAALANFRSLKAGISYENRFLLKELQSQSMTALSPLGKGVISFGAQHFGYKEFRSYKAGVGYSMRLAEKFSMGVQLNYMGLSLNQNYGSSNTFGADVGLFADITENWKLGFSAFNLTRSKLSEYADDRFSTVMRLGTSYQFSDKVVISLEADKDIDYPLRFRSGIEYQLADNFALRAGLATKRMELTFGMGYTFSMFRIDVGTAYDQILGWAPNFTLTFINKEQK